MPDPSLPLPLSPEQRELLLSWRDGAKGRRALAARARLLLSLAEGASLATAAAAAGMKTRTAQAWLGRFNKDGVTGLGDARDRRRGELPRVAEVVASAPGPLVYQKQPGSRLRKVLEAFATVAVLTLAAKGISFFKDAAVASRFGVSDALGAFLLAFGVHTFACGLLIGGLPDAFLPIYARVRHERGELAATRLGLQAMLWHGLTLLAVAALIYTLAPALVTLTGEGFGQEKHDLASELMRGLLPFFLCYGMSGLLSMWLRAEKAFVATSAAPVLTPALILGALLLVKKPTVELLVTTTNWGGLLHLLVLLAVLISRLPLLSPKSKADPWQWENGNREMLLTTAPYLLAGSVHGSSPLVDSVMAGRLSAQSLAVLNYSDKVCSIILALTATAASETLFPYFADTVAKRDWRGMARQLRHSIGLILLAALPVVAFLIWQAEWVVGVLFQRKAFTLEDTQRVAHVLRFAALQIPFYIAGIIMAKVVVALQGKWFMLALSIGSVVLNAAMNWWLMQHLQVAGIALSTAIVHLGTMSALWFYVWRTLASRAAEDGDSEERRAA